MAAKIKKGDNVIVISGNEKGKTGSVKSVLVASGRAIVQGVNVTRKFKKNPQGDSVESVERSVHLSNLQCVDPSTNKGDKVTFIVNEQGNKIRVFKKSGVVLDV